MNKLLATLIAGAFAAVSAAAVAQSTAPEKSAADKAKESTKAAQSTDSNRKPDDLASSGTDICKYYQRDTQQKSNDDGPEI